MDLLSLYLLSYILLLLAAWFILRVWVPRAYQRHGKLPLGVAAAQAVFFFTYGGFPVLYLAEDWPAVHVNRFIHSVGISLLILGLASLFYGAMKLGIWRSIGRGERFLAQSGPYRWSRNPQIIACGLYVIGFTLLWPSWYAAGWALLYFPTFHWMVLAEEEHLRRTFGREYEDYCRRVPRYLGRIGRGANG